MTLEETTQAPDMISCRETISLPALASLSAMVIRIRPLPSDMAWQDGTSSRQIPAHTASPRVIQRRGAGRFFARAVLRWDVAAVDRPAAAGGLARPAPGLAAAAADLTGATTGLGEGAGGGLRPTAGLGAGAFGRLSGSTAAGAATAASPRRRSTI